MRTLGTAVDQIFDACRQQPQFYGDLLHSFAPEITDRRVRLRCPSCNQNSAWVIPGDKIIRCDHANSCGRETSVLSALLGDNAEILTGDPFVQAVKEAARITGIQINDIEIDFTPPRIPTEALEAIWTIANDSIRDKSLGAASVDYLYRRGFTQSFITASFGALSRSAILQNTIDNEILISLGFAHSDGSTNESWSNRILIPARDAYGKIIGFIGRCIAAVPSKIKYLGTTGYQKSVNPFNLHNARKHKKAIITEGQLDVLKLAQHGINNALSVGGCHLSREQLKLFKQHNIEEIVCFFDTDRAGVSGTIKLLDSFDQEPDSPELFIGDIPYGKDPDEYIETFGIAAFLEIANNPIHAHRFRARQWYKECERDGLGILKDGQLPRYIERCAKYLDTAQSARVKIRALDMFLSECCRLSGVERSEVRLIRQELAQAQSRNQSAKSFMAKMSTAYGLVKEGKQTEARQEMQSALVSTAISRGAVISPAEVWQELATYFKRIAEREIIGVKTCFKPFDENLLGARGLMLLAGGSNVGKTTLISQLATDAIMHTTDTCVLFLSFEMLRREINGRILARLSMTDWRDLRDYFREDSHITATSWRDTLCAGLFPHIAILNPVKDDPWFKFSPASVIDEMNALKERSGRNRCLVIVDYVDVVKGQNKEGKDYDELSRGNENVKQQYVCEDMLKIKHLMSEDDPLFCITSVRKEGQSGSREEMTMNDIMGSSLKVYCSDIVCVWNAFSDKYLYEQCDLSHDIHPIMSYLEPIESDWQKQSKDMITRKQISRARKHLREAGWGLSRLELVKVRDGMNKGSFDISVNYRQNYIEQGIRG